MVCAYVLSKPCREVHVSMLDFTSAFATVGPSMQRGFQVQVDKVQWDDLGGLEDVKKVVCQHSIYTCKMLIHPSIEAKTSCGMAATVQGLVQ